MQARPQQSKPGSSHHELSMQLLNKDQAENPPEEHDLLLSEFKKAPFQILQTLDRSQLHNHCKNGIFSGG